MKASRSSRSLSIVRLQSSGDPSLSPVGVELDQDFVSNKNLDAMQAHLAGEIGHYFLTGPETNAEQGIRQSLLDHALYFLCLLLHQLATKCIVSGLMMAVNYDDLMKPIVCPW